GGECGLQHYFSKFSRCFQRCSLSRGPRGHERRGQWAGSLVWPCEGARSATLHREGWKVGRQGAFCSFERTQERARGGHQRRPVPVRGWHSQYGTHILICQGFVLLHLHVDMLHEQMPPRAGMPDGLAREWVSQWLTPAARAMAAAQGTRQTG